MLAWSSGSITPCEDPADVVGRTAVGPRPARGPARRGRRDRGYRAQVSPLAASLDKYSFDLENMPEGRYGQVMDQLAVLKALGDETRYAMYEELARSTAAMSAQDLADRLGLHPNTVRLHLDRLREAGLVDVEAVHRGTVGRPQHLYFLAAGAPGLGFDPPAHAARRAPRRPRRARGRRRRRRHPHRERLGERGRTPHAQPQLHPRARIGAQPARVRARARGPVGGCPRTARIEFLHCPFRELAEAYPELVCNLHRGLCEGVVDAVGGGSVEEFATLYDPEPCHVTVTAQVS